MENWKHPRTITGSVADGARYFRREAVESKLWREIEKGNHILFSAPRRVGKSSVMRYIANHPKEGYTCIYDNISTDQTPEEFYKRILEMLVLQSSKLTKLQEWWNDGWGKIKVSELSIDGLKFGEGQRNYKQALLEALTKVKDCGSKVVLFLDEFPDVIKNISENQKEGPDAAVEVLHTLRSIRHNEHFKANFVLVLAGSVGLAHVVKSIDRPAVINDLHEQNLSALNRNVPEGKSESEADRFVAHLMDGATMQIDVECRNHLLGKLGHAIPFYIQLLVEKCDDLLYEEERTQLSVPDIDRAWIRVLEDHKNLGDADERLRDYFPKDYPYFVKVLTHCAHERSITVQEAYDMGLEFGIGTEYKGKIDDVLVKDGYLQQEGLNFQFVSPLLQEWWTNRHPKITKKA
jgi:uncharacterized protein